MGGEIRVSSDVGRGSCFEILIYGISPAAPLEPQPGLLGKGEGEQFEAGQVLVVDDIDTNRGLVKALLRNSGLAIREASDGAEALEILRQSGADLVFLDIHMPVMDGIETLKVIRSDPNLQHLPVYALTASVMGDALEKFRQSGFDGLLAKPLEPHELFSTLRRHFKVSPKTQTGEARSTNESTDASEFFGDCSRIAPLIERLSGEYSHQWEALKRRKSFNEIARFGGELLKLGNDTACPAVESFGRDIADRAQRFDIAGITQALDNYPRLLARLRQACDGSGASEPPP